MADHLEIQEKVYEEFTDVLDKENVNHESIASLKYVLVPLDNFGTAVGENPDCLL